MKPQLSLLNLILCLSLILPSFSAYSLEKKAAPEKKTAPIRPSALTPVELLTNDKEADSIVLSAEDRDQAKDTLGDFSRHTEALKRIAETVAPLIFTHEVACEAAVLDQLYESAVKEGLIKDRSGLTAVLVALRSQDRMDDVILLPLWKALPAFLSVGKFVPEINATPMATPAENQDADEKRRYELLGGASRACPTDTLLVMKAKLHKELGKKYHRHMLWKEIKQAHKDQMIDDSAYAWLGALFTAEYDRAPFTLSMVAPKVRDVKNKSNLNSPLGSPTKIASKKKKKTKGLSNRLYLYQKYTAEQILLIGDMFYRFSRHNWAAKVELVWTYDEEGKDVEKRTLTLMEQYHAAVRTLHVEFASEARVSDIFSGLVIDYDDVVMATLEVGLMPGTDVDRLMKIDDLWSPKVPKWQKIAKAVQTYGGPALIFVPPPFNMISTMALVLLQGTLLKTKSTKHGDDLGTELF